MPPKKKQEQIDLSTLPECKSLNIFLYCKGKSQRAKKILTKIDSKYDKMIFHVKRSAILDYAKQKGIYVDPDSLTDKQKKDPKFMQTVCTQLTPQVLAKATDAYINNQNVKIRLQKKALLQKPQTAQQQKMKKIDCIYIFDDFPTQSSDFDALSSANQGIKFVFVIQPKISWASAPQQPQIVQNADDEPAQPDEQYEQYKKLKQAQILNEEDINRDKNIDKNILQLRNARKKTATNSAFRNTVIEYLKCTIDPYAQDSNIDELVKSILPTCEQLLNYSAQFNSWVNQKKTQELPQITQNVQKGLNKKQKKKQSQITDNVMEFLQNVINTINPAKNKENQIQKIDFSDFDFDAIDQNKRTGNNNQYVSQKYSNPYYQFLQYNQNIVKVQRQFLKEILKTLKYPGLDRFSMPEIPPKSQGVRKLFRSSFGQFLPHDLSFQDFQRKMNILFIQNAAKQSDQERTYDFSNRVYEQQHQKQSLLRQLNKAMLFDQSTVVLKYNQNNDKLYICLLYKNPARRMSKKLWQCNWKVLPNLQNWLKYFKDNESNLSNNQFFNIDYELIGNIQQQVKSWSIKDGGVIIRKKSSIAGKQNQLLYCIPGSNSGNLIFGMRIKNENYQFYGRNEIVSIVSTELKKSIKNAQKPQQQKQQKQKSIILTFKDSTIIQLKQNGDIVIKKQNQKPRIITSDGYTILTQSNDRKNILHPNGGITYPPNKYINPHGRGLSEQKIVQVPTLRRFTKQNQQLVTRRDDKTVIIQQGSKKLITFPDQTTYLHQNDQLIIEKNSYPRFILQQNRNVIFSYDGTEILMEKNQNGFQYTLSFQRICHNNFSKIKFNKDSIQVYDGRTESPYVCNIKQNGTISKSWEGQSISVSFTNSTYQRNNKNLDPQEDEENYNQQDVLKPDYVEPRIFIINNNNTGIQLLSEKQLQKGYFDNFTSKLNNQSQLNDQKKLQQEIFRSQIRKVSHPKFAHKQIIHGIQPIPQPNQLNKKVIKKIPINLDIFNNTVNEKVNDNDRRLLQVRSLIKHQPLTKQDRNLITEIITKRNQWQSKSQRQDNQYGFKNKNDPSTLQRFQSKKKVIQFRKMNQEQILSQKMRKQAIHLYEKQTQNRIKVLQNIQKEIELRKKLSKKKSYVSKYNWKEPQMIEADQNYQYYNPESTFYTNYFQTSEGKKALSLMPQWIFRPKETKKPQQLDPQIRQQLNATMNRTKKQQQNIMNNTNPKFSVNQQQRNQRYDTVEPDLKPVEVYIKPSVFTQKQIQQQRYAFETQKKAYQYHERKRKDFDVYGRDRKDKVEVPSLMRTQPISQLNQKYLVTEAPVDKKVKISSMKNKLTSQASNMTQMRKQGPHANLIRTLDKGNDYNKLLEKRTMMVQADLNDRLQRDIQINPIEANFGMVKQGGNYELKIQIKNEDVLAQRIHLKKPKSIFCKVQMKQMGPIALGMTRKISVFLKAAPEILGKFTDQFQIVTKHQIYHIPIVAQILSKNQFESSGSVLSKTVRQFEQLGKKKREQLPPIKGNQ